MGRMITAGQGIGACAAFVAGVTNVYQPRPRAAAAPPRGGGA
jgi:hypothetical protein